MSGPKVVRIVTREEILEICYGQLARVDAALAEWIRVGERNECIDEEAVAHATKRRDALAALIASDRFMDLQKQAPMEEAFLREDMQARLAKVAAEQAATRSRARREGEAAKALLRSLRTKGLPLEPELEAGLARGEAEAVSKGFQLLFGTSAGPTGSTELAAQLRETGDTQTYTAWLAAQPLPPSDPAAERIEARLDELNQVLNPAEVAQLRSRLDDACSQPTTRRSLVLDGLEVETGRLLAEARRRAGILSELELTLAELTASRLPTHGYWEDLEALDGETVRSRLSDAKNTLDANRKEKAAAARRAAVLEGLVGLGYEVNEGMSTTFADSGRLVLRSASRPDYGVEVSAAGNGERMQMRAVAFESGGRGPDVARDRDAETIWCEDVSTLQNSLAEVGGGLQIEKALPVGATPLKRVVIDASSSPDGAEAPILKERTLR